jgi:hypothetical protein
MVSLRNRAPQVSTPPKHPVRSRSLGYRERVMLSRLVYYSEERDVGVHGVLRILDEARAGNQGEEITGVLAFDRRWFLQCLEGSRDVVTRKFLAIARDPRHSGVTLVAFEGVSERLFPDWSMGAVDVGALGRGRFDPPLMTASTALETLCSLQAAGATM